MSESTEPEIILLDDGSNDTSPDSSASQTLSILSLFQQILKHSPLKAAEAFEKIIKTSIETKLDRAFCDRAAEEFIEAFKTFSQFKKRRVAEEISLIDLPAKIFLCNKMGIDSFLPWDVCFNNSRGVADSSSFEKPSMRTSAMGKNEFGKLGVGSDEKYIDRLKDVKLFGEVYKVLIGKKHSIFFVRNKGIYGCGKASNFMQGYEGSEEIFTTPVKLDYVAYHDELDVVLNYTSTEFRNYSSNRDLIVGQWRDDDPGIVSRGPNWRVLSELGSSGGYVLPVTMMQISRQNHFYTENMHNVICSDDLGTQQSAVYWVQVRTSQNWEKDLTPQMPVVIANGYRIDVTNRPIQMEANGYKEIYAASRGVFYKGQLRLVPAEQSRKRAHAEDNSETSSHLVSSQKPNILTAVLEEVVLPYSVDGFTVEDCSFIFHARNSENLQSNKSDYWLVGYPYYFTVPINKDRSYMTENAPKLHSFFEEYVENGYKEYYDRIFNIMGLVTVELMLPMLALLTLRNFLELDKATKIPIVFLKCAKAYEGLDIVKPEELEVFCKKLEKEMLNSTAQDKDLPIVVRKTRWSEQNRTDRLSIMKKESEDFISHLISDITNSMRHLMNLPLVYRKHSLDLRFCYFVLMILESYNKHIERYKENYQPSSFEGRYFIEEETVFGPVSVVNAMKNNVEKSEWGEPRFRTIVIEAFVILYSHDKDNKPIVHHKIYERTINWIFLQYMDSTLIREVDENNILNLNKICLRDDSPLRFRNLVHRYFSTDEDVNEHRFCKKEYNMSTFFSTLAPTDKYYITTSDKTIVECPKILFEIFSAYDAARRRNCDGNLHELQLDFKETTVQALLCVVMDISVFPRMDMDMKLEVFKIARFCIFTHLIEKLLLLIIVTAEEEDVYDIRQLFGEHRESVIEMIGKYRPEMILFWEISPIPEEQFWDDYKLICEEIAIHHYREVDECARRVKKDEVFDDYEISKSWIRQEFFDKEKDKDIETDAENIIASWNTRTPAREDHARKSNLFWFNFLKHRVKHK